MKDREIIERLRAEAEEHTPDVAVDLRAARLENGLGEVAVAVRKKRVWLAAAAAFLVLVLLLAVLLPMFARGDPGGITTLVISINPSAEFTIQEGKVTKTRPLNRDAAVLLADKTLDGMTAEDACLTFASLAKDRNLIGADGVRIRVTGKDQTAVSASVHGVLDALFTVGELDDAALQGILGSYDEETMDRFEDYVSREYEGKQKEYLARAKELLQTYRADLLALDFGDRAAVEEFNRKYLMLGEDLLAEQDDDDEPEEIREDLLEEYEEIVLLIDKNPEKAFEELFEEFLELFEQDFDD